MLVFHIINKTKICYAETQQPYLLRVRDQFDFLAAAAVSAWPAENFSLQLLDGFHQRQLPALRPLEKHAGRQETVDLIGAFEDAINARIAVSALHRIVLMEAVAPVDLHAFIRYIVEHLGREHLNVRTFGRVLLDRFHHGLAGVRLSPGEAFHFAFNQTDYPVAHRLSGVNPDRHLSQLVLDHAEL